MRLKKINFSINELNKKTKKKYLSKINLFLFSINHFIVANAHLGYEINRWNPQIRFILWGIRSNLHVLDVQKTILTFKRLSLFMTNLIKLRKTILYASENKNIDYVIKKIVLLEKQHIASNRWIGGIITNFKEIRKNIKILTTRYHDGIKYQLLSNRRKKLKNSLEGLITLYQMPALLIILNGVKSKWAINEIKSKKIPAVVISDSIMYNYNITYVLPGNVYGFATQILYLKLFQHIRRNAQIQELIYFVKVKKISNLLRNKLYII